MKYFSMFTGIGGFELGIEQAYSRVERDRQEDSSLPGGQETVNGTGVGNQQAERPSDELDQREATCVGYSEIDKYADATYKSHFGGHINYGDATKINAGELPDFDLLVGGFPCQAFSVAGKRAGFNDTRGTLFFDIARILKEKQPRHLVLENVKGLLGHDQGRTFQTIVGVLTDLGYFVEWQVLNSKDFGVPQNRERVFIVGHLGGEPRRKVFPIFGTDSKDIIVSGVLDTETWRKRHEQIRRFHSVEGLSPTIPTGTGGGVMTKIEVKPRIRRLTPLECERLQGFPDNWTVGSDTQRYKQCGNAVTVNVVEAVMSKFNDKYKED